MTHPTPTQPPKVRLQHIAPWSPWRTVVGFGVVSLSADMVYEGARSVTGPLLASLGASAALVGLVTGAGEATALLLRLLFGTVADRTGRYWTLTLAGYTLTAVCVPLLAVTPFLGTAGLAAACALILAERTGKAVRSPAKSALLADAAGEVGMGRGLGVHKALDQVGAFAGPLLVSAVAAATSALWPAMAALAIPGAAAIALLLFIRARSPDSAGAPDAGPRNTTITVDANPGPDAATQSKATATHSKREPLPRTFYLFAASAGATTAGLVTFGVIAFHLTTTNLVPVAVVPLVYAAAMATEAVVALATGYLYDRWNAAVLLLLPFLVAAVPALAFGPALPTVVAGVLIWGAATGIQDSTVKALVADLVDRNRRATAYGVFAAIQGAAAIAGGGAAGVLYSRSIPILVAFVATTQLIAFLVLTVTLVQRGMRS